MKKSVPYSFCYRVVVGILKLSGELVGRVVRLKLPGVLAPWSIRLFARLTKVNIAEAEKDIGEYASVGDFFVRRLAENVRPVQSGLVSPVDGRVIAAGRCAEGQTFVVKGEQYSIAELLGNGECADCFNDGYFLVCYLAPGGYHRIHSPIEGSVIRRIHIVGECWPVNSIGMRFISKLFVRNERVVTLIQAVQGLVAVVKVGALNVASIKTTYEIPNDISAMQNNLSRGVEDFKFNEPVKVSKGQDIGYFEMGSTVVLLVSGSGFVPGEHWQNGPVKMGLTVGDMQGEKLTDE